MAMQHHHKLLLHQPQGYFRKLSSWVQQCRHKDLTAKTRAAGQVAAVPSLFSVNLVLSLQRRPVCLGASYLSLCLDSDPGGDNLSATTFVFPPAPLLCSSPSSDVLSISAYQGLSQRSLVLFVPYYLKVNWLYSESQHHHIASSLGACTSQVALTCMSFSFPTPPPLHPQPFPSQLV